MKKRESVDGEEKPYSPREWCLEEDSLDCLKRQVTTRARKIRKTDRRGSSSQRLRREKPNRKRDEHLKRVKGKLESQETRDTQQGRLLHRRREAHVQDPQAQKPAKVRKNKTKVGAGQKTCSHLTTKQPRAGTGRQSNLERGEQTQGPEPTPSRGSPSQTLISCLKASLEITCKALTIPRQRLKRKDNHSCNERKKK